jgi:hypothetical protein
MTRHVDVWAPILLVLVLGYIVTFGMGYGY